MKKNLAPYPPMGWNSWDCYGASVTEEEVRGNALYMAENLKQYGWEYVVTDIQWYQPTASSGNYVPFADLCMDEYGRLLPAENRFPSAAGGQGFRPLADYVHSLGLKFGVHLMRGIPRQAVHANTPVMGTDKRARDVAHPNLTCAWNTDMYGVNAQADGAYEYYLSVFQLFAQWGIDMVKIDDLSCSHSGSDAYSGAGEMELYALASQNCGRDILLSFSPGPSPREHAEHLAANGHMWRITNDFWDNWNDMMTDFDACHRWEGVGGENAWPDADMLPIGHIGIRCSERDGSDRMTRFTKDEQYTLLTLWCIFRSPLMLGCEMRDMDDFTKSLITNEEVLSLLRLSRDAREVFRRGNYNQHVVWLARCAEGGWYLALFNTGDTKTEMSVLFGQLGLPEKLKARDLWAHRDEGVLTGKITAAIPSHGARLWKLEEI